MARNVNAFVSHSAGENKLSARNAAAEQAIRDIVLKKMERYSEVMALQAANETEGELPSS